MCLRGKESRCEEGKGRRLVIRGEWSSTGGSQYEWRKQLLVFGIISEALQIAKIVYH